MNRNIAQLIITGSSLYKGQYINCSSSTVECTIECQDSYSCEQAIINCPTDANCNLECQSTRACLNTRVHWPINGEGNVICNSGTETCGGLNFPIPPPNQPYSFTCDEPYECQYAHMYCPINADCTITCYSIQGCEYMDIIWSLNKTITSTLIWTYGSDSVDSTDRPPIYAIDDNTDLNVNCTTHSECTGAYIICPQNASCNILCNHNYACYNMKLKPPVSGSFSIRCMGSYQYSCARIIYDQYDQNEPLILDCSGSNMCQESIINCPKNADCNVTCSGIESCYKTRINCPNDPTKEYFCNIWCSGDNSCNSATITGYGRVLECDGISACQALIFPKYPPNEQYYLTFAADSSGSQAKVHCPSNGECHIACTGSNSCTETFFIWPTDLVSLFNSSLSCIQGCDSNTNYPANYTINTDVDGNYVCDLDRECIGSVIQCPSDKQCSIGCSGYWGCVGAIFLWDYNQPYTLNCDSSNYDATCYGVTISQYNNNVDMNVDCVKRSGCGYSTVVCPENASCTITCRGDYDSCKYMTVHGPIGHSLTINCIENSDDTTKSNLCYRMTIHAQDASSFRLNGCAGDDSPFKGQNDNVCYGMVIIFPENDNGVPRAVINGSNNAGLSEVIFYAKYGWADIDVMNYDKEFHHEAFDGRYGIDHKGKMLCGPNYNFYCDFAWNDFKCTPYGDTTCNFDDIITFEPTIPPTTIIPSIFTPTPVTNVSTSIPTTSAPSRIPSEIPTSTPSAIPTVIPTHGPTTMPTAGPTARPTSLPTAGPATMPTTGSPITSVPSSDQTTTVTGQQVTETTLSQTNAAGNETTGTDDDLTVIIIIIIFIILCCVVILILIAIKVKKERKRKANGAVIVGAAGIQMLNSTSPVSSNGTVTAGEDDGYLGVTDGNTQTTNKLSVGSDNDVINDFVTPIGDDDDDNSHDNDIVDGVNDDPKLFGQTTGGDYDVNEDVNDEFVVAGDSEDENDNHLTHGNMTTPVYPNNEGNGT